MSLYSTSVVSGSSWIRRQLNLMMVLAVCLGIGLVAGQIPAGASSNGQMRVGDDGRIIAHDLDEVDWAWDIEFKFNSGSGLHNRPEYGLMRVYSKEFPENAIRYQTIKCVVVGDVNFNAGVASFDGGYLRCPMPSLEEAFAGTAAPISDPSLITVGAKLERAGSGPAPILHHPDIRFSVLGAPGQTQFELWARGSSTARSPKFSTGTGSQTMHSTIQEKPDSPGSFHAGHTLFGHGSTSFSANRAPDMASVDETVFYVGYSPYAGSATFRGELDHLFVDPGKFR